MTHYNNISGQKISRVEALSDGVFSIAMTILVFDLKDPVSHVVHSDMELLLHLQSMIPKFISYFLSFMTLGIFWTGQSTQFSHIRKYDRNLNWINLIFLMFVSLLPFTTSFLSDHINNKVPIALYWFNLSCLGAFLFFHWSYAKKSGYIFSEQIDIKQVDKAIVKRIFISQSLYSSGALLCIFDNYLSIAFIMLVQLNYAVNIFRKRK